jgi:hypothetical protein
MSVIETKLTGRGLSEGSLKLYEANLKRLNNNQPIKNLTFLKDTESIINKIKEKKDTTARSYIIAICSILKNDPKMKKQQEIYYKLLIEYNDKLKDNNTKSDKQKEEWISQNEVKQIYECWNNIIVSTTNDNILLINRYDFIDINDSTIFSSRKIGNINIWKILI